MAGRCVLTVDVEALRMRASDKHIDTLIYGKAAGEEFGIGRMMDIADKHEVKMSFFVDFAECELYGENIIDVGRYVLGRGHDLQVHCHYDLLKDIVDKNPWISMTDNYYSWYVDYEDSKRIVDYVTDKFVRAAGYEPIAFRGGEYRFGAGVLKALKEKGYLADLSYNYVRPQILKPNKQFMFENGLMEIPVGIMPNRRPLNFNYSALVPKSRDEYDDKIKEYEELFEEFFDYYGDDTIASMLMHSWSFMHTVERFSSCGFIDTPNKSMAEFFDYYLSYFKERIDFISVTEAIEQLRKENLKTVDFKTVFRENPPIAPQNLLNIGEFIKKKAGNRKVVIWGKGWMESLVFQTINYHEILDTECYISNDADKRSVWRNKPVYKFNDYKSKLSSQKHYVYIVAQASFSEIRDSLKELGFSEYDDYFDIQKSVPEDRSNGVKSVKKSVCSICGGEVFETYNSNKARRCFGCGSVERSRTIPKLFDEDIKVDFKECKFLHVSPSNPERRFFKDRNIEVTSIDIRPECKTDIVADICNMPEVPDSSYDVVFANCVLNHVYDDEAALNEINRVLVPGGKAILWVLDSGSLKTVIHEDPTGWYGKENYEKYRIGTFRHYGEQDFIKQLYNHFSKVRCYEKYDEVTDSSCKWYVCEK